MSEVEMAEREVKPKKLFEVKLDIYDDGICVPSYIEIDRTDRGTKKWTLRQHEFALAVKALLGEGIDKVLSSTVSIDSYDKQEQKG